MNAPLRNALVMLPQQDEQSALWVRVNQMPAPVAALAAVRRGALPEAAQAVLCVTFMHWASLPQDGGKSPMPLHTREKIKELRGEFATLVRHGTGMPKDVRKKLPALREEFAKLASRGRFVDAESQDWYALPERWRMVLLILCGIDGDMPTLAARNFQELPPPERRAIKAEVRIAQRIFARLPGLASLW